MTKRDLQKKGYGGKRFGSAVVFLKSYCKVINLEKGSQTQNDKIRCQLHGETCATYLSKASSYHRACSVDCGV